MESTLPGRNGEVLEIFHPSMDKVHGCVQFCIDNVFQTIEFLKLSCDKRALLICEYGEYTLSFIFHVHQNNAPGIFPKGQLL